MRLPYPRGCVESSASSSPTNCGPCCRVELPRVAQRPHPAGALAGRIPKRSLRPNRRGPRPCRRGLPRGSPVADGMADAALRGRRCPRLRWRARSSHGRGHAARCGATAEAFVNELPARLLLILVGLVLLVSTLAAARASRCNLRRARQAFALPPLAHVTSAALAGQHQIGTPSRWPPPSSLDTEMRAAYARLARDRADNRTLIGELILIVSGAATGAAITSAIRSTAATWGLTLALLLGAVGILLRTFATRRWTEVAEEYER